MRLQRKKKPGAQHQESQAFIQPKLKVGQPGDKYEVEADKMADQVVNKPSSKTEGAIQKKSSEEEVQQKPLASTITPLVQRSMFKDRNEGTVQKMEEEEPVQKMEEEEPVQKMEEEEPVQKMEEEESVQKMEEEESVQKMEEEETVQSKCDDCEKEESVKKMEEEESVQAKSNTNLVSSNSDKDSSIESRLKSSKGKGNKMSGDTKNEMETGFGADFSNVNIHTDTNAVQLSQELGAQAFTHGNDVYFNKGKYNPDSKEGKHLLAHELTHTVQQNGMIQRSVSEKESKDLQAERFKGNFRLEQAHDHVKFIRKGSKGSHVEKLQKGLINIGFALPQFGADGDFGNETERAVFGFQNAYNLSVDGIVGSETMGTLDDIYTNNISKVSKKDCSDKVGYNETFTSHTEVPFYSTPKCKKIKVEINAESISNTSCTDFSISIDGVSRTKRTIVIDPTKKVTRKVFNFKMRKAKKYRLIFKMPEECKAPGNLKSEFKVSGSIIRYS